MDLCSNNLGNSGQIYDDIKYIQFPKQIQLPFCYPQNLSYPTRQSKLNLDKLPPCRKRLRQLADFPSYGFVTTFLILKNRLNDYIRIDLGSTSCVSSGKYLNLSVPQFL